MKTKIVRVFTRVCIWCLVIVVHVSANAQTNTTNESDARLEDETSLVLDEIVVTGTRIKRSAASSPTPTMVLEAESIKRSGVANLGDLLHELPAISNGTGGNAINDANGGATASAGLEFLNLRGLGEERTLVLIDGRRHVPGSAGDAAVDISMIPTNLIERVEVISGGASAVYGADAVTGVVNIITKKAFDGWQIDYQAGASAQGDGETNDLSVLFGRNFHNGKGNVMISASYYDENEISIAARDYANRLISFNPNPANTGPNDGIPDQLLVDDLRFTPLNREGTLALVNNARTNRFVPIEQLATFGGLPLFPGDPIGLSASSALGDGLAPGQLLFDSFTIDRESGQVRAFDEGINCDFVACQGGDGFRTPETNTLSVPIERTILDLSSSYEFDSSRVFANLKYGNVKSNASGQASVFHDGNFGPYVPIFRDNPFLPAALAAEMDARGLSVAPLAVVGVAQRSDTERETIQFIIGGEGKMNNAIDYVYYAQYGRVESKLGDADVLNSRYYQALDATTDASGMPVCRDTSGGCQPLNIFNSGLNSSPESLDFVEANVLNRDEIEQVVIGASVNGDLFELPAGTSKFALGIEYRNEKAENIPDPLLQARDPVTGAGAGLVGSLTQIDTTLNGFVLPTSGRFDVTEVFGEVTLPIISDKPFFDEVTLDAALRVADYNLSGTEVSYKTGLNWAMNDSLRLRATYSRAVRAPNVTELFDPLAPGAGNATDPCHVEELDFGPNPDNRRANCAALGLPEDFLSLAAVGTVTITNGGNLELDPERADTFTLGMVITPTPTSYISLDLWDVEVNDAITVFGASTVLANCVDGANLNPVFCNDISRSGSGQITNIFTQFINAAEFSARGVDITAGARFDGPGSGEFSVDFLGSVMDTREFLQDADDLETLVEEIDTAGNPELRGSLNLGYRSDKWLLSWDMRFVGSSKFSGDVQPEELPVNRVPSFLYHDVFSSYQLRDNLEVFLGVNNVLDKEPPALPDLNTGGLLYDGVGRYYFAGLRFTK